MCKPSPHNKQKATSLERYVLHLTPSCCMSTTYDTQCTVRVIKSPKVGAQENVKEGQPFKFPSLSEHPIHLIPVQKGSHRNVIYCICKHSQIQSSFMLSLYHGSVTTQDVHTAEHIQHETYLQYDNNLS
jgi:hypothetical protein